MVLADRAGGISVMTKVMAGVKEAVRVSKSALYIRKVSNYAEEQRNQVFPYKRMELQI